MKNIKDHVLIKLAQELAAQGYIRPEHVKNALTWGKTSGGELNVWRSDRFAARCLSLDNVYVVNDRLACQQPFSPVE